MKALHVHFEGYTASFRRPLFISGTKITTLPAYSTLLGIISACAGRVVRPQETRIGFEFACSGMDVELERTERLQFEGGRLKPHAKGQGVGKRQVYLHPRLDLYVTNCELRSAFEYPRATPCFGQSQDVAWITDVAAIELGAVSEGDVGPTLLPYPQKGIAGLVVSLPDWFDNDVKGRTRLVGAVNKFEAILPFTTTRYHIQQENLFHPSDAVRTNDVLYLHDWQRT